MRSLFCFVLLPQVIEALQIETAKTSATRSVVRLPTLLFQRKELIVHRIRRRNDALLREKKSHTRTQASRCTYTPPPGRKTGHADAGGEREEDENQVLFPPVEKRARGKRGVATR